MIHTPSDKGKLLDYAILDWWYTRSLHGKNLANGATQMIQTVGPEIIEEKLINVCAAGRIKLQRKDGVIIWRKERELGEYRIIDSITYKYVGVEHGVGIYSEI